MDGNSHGYDWEIKPGGLARIFHPRNSLSGVSYGNINKYYIKASKQPDEEISSRQESIDRGLTVIQEDGIAASPLAEDVILPGNEDLMANVRAANWAKVQENKAAYEVPTLKGNWTIFVKEILNSQL